MSNLLIKNYLHGYPNYLGNKKQVVLEVFGPSTYVAGGVSLPSLAHVHNIHYVNCSMANNGTLYLSVVPKFDLTAPQSLADLKFVFIDPADGEEAAGDLSAYVFRLEVVGTN